MILVDSDAYLALNVEQDAHHKRAVKLLEQLIEMGEDFVTTWEVIDEVTTKLSYFTTKNKADEFLKLMLISDTKIEFVDRIRAKLINKLFTVQSSKRVSLTDCANMVVARELRVKRIFSFDGDYERNGFELV